tara:strand:+ start:595 stop:957 length:363 start_codon:yes stop_codon:yes gene_type:complete
MTKKQLLNESWLKMFGEWNKDLLKYIYGKDVKMRANLEAHNMIREEDDDVDSDLQFSITGEEADVKAYANALMAQKYYIDAYVMHGAEHMRTIKQKEVLKQAVHHFETSTGITWPFTTEG